MNNFDTRTITIDGKEIAYAALEREDSEKAIVFLHGWRSSSAAWRPILTRLKNRENLSLYALDLPGFGLSPLLKKVMTTADYASVVERFIDTLALSNVVIVGHSFGGQVGISVGSNYSKELAKLILVNSAGVREPSRKTKTIHTLAKLVSPLFSFPLVNKLRGMFYKLIGANDYAETPENLRPTFKKVTSEDIQRLLSKIQTSTLLVWGDKDSDTPLSDGNKLHEKLPHSQMIVLEGAGHYSFLDQPDKFVRELVSFVKN